MAVTRYLDRLLAGEMPTVDEWNDHLAEFHRIHQGSGNTPFSRLLSASGETSYDFLSNRVRDLHPRARAVLEVGCGDGNLLFALRGAFGDTIELGGVDASEHEIDRARARLPRARFFHGDVAKIDLEQDAFDVVTAHFSVRAISNLSDALRQFHKTLRPGGLAAFLLEAPLESPLLARLASVAVTTIREVHPQFAISMPATLQIEAREDFEAALKAAGFTGELRTERVGLLGELSGAEIAESMLLSYPFAFLDESLRTEIRNRWRSELKSGSKDLIGVELPVILVTVEA